MLGKLSAIDGAAAPYCACEPEKELPKRLGVIVRVAILIRHFAEEFQGISMLYESYIDDVGDSEVVLRRSLPVEVEQL